MRFAEGWLAKYGGTVGATFLLEPLISRFETSEQELDAKTLTKTLGWLEQYGQTKEARFVYRALLIVTTAKTFKLRDELASWIQGWLEKHGATAEAGTVLGPFITWASAEDEAFFKKVARSCFGLVSHINVSPAFELFLSQLLLERKVPGELRYEAARCGLQIAQELREQDTHLLRTLLQAAARHREEVPSKEILIHAGKWLDKHKNHVERAFVMARILRNLWLPDDAWIRVASAALELLSSRPVKESDDYVLNGVLMRLGLLSDSQIGGFMGLMCLWLARCKNQLDASNVVHNLKRQLWLGTIPDEHIQEFSAAYLRRFPDAPEIDWGSAE
jgi:rRNA maturation endonuclease Nob1